MPFSVVTLQLHPARAGAHRAVGALPGVVDDGRLRRRARLHDAHARGAPRHRRRLEPVAAGDGGPHLRPHQERSWPRSPRCSRRCTTRSHRRGHRGARPRQRWPARRHRRHRLPARASTRRSARTGSGRGALQDEAIDTMLKAWTGEPFEYRGTTVQVTPRPFTQPHPTLMIGGTSKARGSAGGALRPAVLTAAHLPELEAYYYEQCAEHGTQGFCMMPGEETVMMHVAEDPDHAWAELGKYFWHEASQYAGVADPRHPLVGALLRARHRVAARRGHLPGVHARRARRAHARRRATSPRATSTRSSVGCPSTRGGSRCSSTWSRCSRSSPDRPSRGRRVRRAGVPPVLGQLLHV